MAVGNRINTFFVWEPEVNLLNPLYNFVALWVVMNIFENLQW